MRIARSRERTRWWRACIASRSHGSSVGALSVNIREVWLTQAATYLTGEMLGGLPTGLDAAAGSVHILAV